MQFILIAHDKAGGLPLRKATRAAHLAYFREKVGAGVVYGGPLLGEDGEPKGSMLIIEAADLAEARAIFADDPYALVGLFESVAVTGFRTVFRDGVLQG